MRLYPFNIDFVHQMADRSTVFPSTDIYDVATGAWTATAPLGSARISHSPTVLSDGRVLIAGGQGVGASNTAEIYDPG